MATERVYAHKDTTISLLSEPFDRSVIRIKRGQGGREMQYISHALVTQRLNAVDPGWESHVRDLYTYTDGNGRIHCEGVVLALTVNGTTRFEAGGPSRQDGFTNEVKNAMSDALKRCAMRFGVALDMWDSLVDAEHDEDAHPELVEEPTEPRRLEPAERKQVVAMHERIVKPAPDGKDERIKGAYFINGDGEVVVPPSVSRQHGIKSMDDLNGYLQQGGYTGGRKGEVMEEIENAHSVTIHSGRGVNQYGQPDLYPGELYDIVHHLDAAE